MRKIVKGHEGNMPASGEVALCTIVKVQNAVIDQRLTSFTSSIVNIPEKWSMSSSETSAGTKALQNTMMESLLSMDGLLNEIAVSTRVTHVSNWDCNDAEEVFLKDAAIFSITDAKKIAIRITAKVDTSKTRTIPAVLFRYQSEFCSVNHCSKLPQTHLSVLSTLHSAVGSTLHSVLCTCTYCMLYTESYKMCCTVQNTYYRCFTLFSENALDPPQGSNRIDQMMMMLSVLCALLKCWRRRDCKIKVINSNEKVQLTTYKIWGSWELLQRFNRIRATTMKLLLLAVCASVLQHVCAFSIVRPNSFRLSVLSAKKDKKASTYKPAAGAVIATRRPVLSHRWS